MLALMNSPEESMQIEGQSGAADLPLISKQQVKTIRPEQSVMTMQGLPYFVGISGRTAGTTGLAMHLVLIPPGARATPHLHLGYETAIYVLEGRVLTRWGDQLENEVVNQAGDFLFVPPNVPHEAVNLSQTEPARAIVARNDAADQDKIAPWPVQEPSGNPSAPARSTGHSQTEASMNQQPGKTQEQQLREEEIADRAKRETIVSQTIPGMDEPLVKPGDPSGHRKGGKSTADEDLN
jgi:uncharacterized RmlC-like cupin family protein